jgi:hypothetical protein
MRNSVDEHKAHDMARRQGGKIAIILFAFPFFAVYFKNANFAMSSAMLS